MISAFRSRLVLSNLFIVLLGLLALFLVSTQLLSNQADQTSAAKKQDLLAQAHAMSEQIEGLYQQGGSPSQLHTQVDSASRLLHQRIIIVNARGQFRVDSARVTPFVTGSWRQVNEGALKSGRTSTATLGQNVYRFQSPIKGSNGRQNGAVLLVAKVADVRPPVDLLQRLILISLVTAILVWLLLGLYFTRSIFRPLLQVAAATETMAKGDYRARVRVAGSGEISLLAVRFNHMAHQVQQANQVLKDFVANVSHDLRTPLTMITGFSQALLDGTARPHEVRDSAEVIHEESLKMERLVNDLLQLTKFESGLMSLDLQPRDLRSHVQAVIERVARAHAGQTARLENAVPSDLPPVAIDDTQLERALTNLLNNALQHTPAEGFVRIEARRDRPGWVQTTVSDSGSGIPRQDLNRIFERFYRSDRSRARSEGRSGLGLAIVREIVEAHGGKVTAESQAGAGTTFRFTIPEAPGEPFSNQAAADGRAAAHQPAT